MQTKLILIRHGITTWNKQRRYCGYKDVCLSNMGEKQTAKLHKRLKSVNFDRVYSSDRKRAIQTAKIIFNGTRITRVKDLRELNFGVFEGLNYREIMKKYPSVYKRWMRNPFRNGIPKAECLHSFKKRINTAIKRIVRLNQGKTVAVVCHGGTIGMFITDILKKKSFWRYVPDAASISIVEYKNDKPKIKLFNCTEHLR